MLFCISFSAFNFVLCILCNYFLLFFFEAELSSGSEREYFVCDVDSNAVIKDSVVFGYDDVPGKTQQDSCEGGRAKKKIHPGASSQVL